MKVYVALFFLLFTVPTLICEAQPYIFSKPVRLSSNVNSGSEESMPVYDAKNKVLYIARAVHKGNVGGRFTGFDIWFSHRKDNDYFTRAKNLKSLNTIGNNAIVGIDSDTEGLFLMNAYDGTHVTSGLSRASVNEKGGYEQPEYISVEGLKDLVDNKFYSLTMNNDKGVLLLSMQGTGSIGKEDLYVSFKFKGVHPFLSDTSTQSTEWWSKPIYMGETINSYGFETAPVLAPDDKTVFFCSDRRDDYNQPSNADIYYSVRLDDTWQNWSEPVNVGDSINSPKFDGYLFLTDSGEYFFASDRRKGLADIYMGKYWLSEADTIESKIPIKDLPTAEELNRLNENAITLKFEPKADELSIDHFSPMQRTIALLEKYTDLKAGFYMYKNNTEDLNTNKEREINLTDYLLSKGIHEDKFFFIDSQPEGGYTINDVRVYFN